jgi:transposase
MSRTSPTSNTDLPPPSDCRVPRPSRGDGWNALADIEVFVFAVEAELEVMDRERIGVHRRGRKPDLALRRRLIGLIWTLTFGGMQWRIAGWLSGVPFTTLHSAFARWSRLGLWRRLGQRLAFDWRLACGDEVLPSAVVADSRSLRSAPTAWVRGIDGGKLVKGVKLFAVCDKHGSLLDLELRPANTGWPRSASKVTSSATAASRARLSPRPRSSMTSTSPSRLAARGTDASCRTASGGSSSGYSPGLAATGGSTSSTTAPPTSLPRTSGLR